VGRVTKPVEERRKEIINTAQELFIENGFDKTQMADISKKMNVAQGLVYHYFKSKTDILYAIIDIMADEQILATEELFDQSNGSARDKLAVLFNSQTILKDYSKLIPILISDSAIIEYCLKKMIISALPLLVSLIEYGNEDGSWNYEYPEMAAAFILHGISGVIGVLSPVYQDENEQKALLDVVLRFFESGK